MLRIYQTFLGFLLVAGVSGSSPAQVKFERTYGGGSVDEGYSVRQTEDGGYVIAGGTWSFGAGSADVYLVKTDSLGDTLWTKTYGGLYLDWALSVEQTQDGGYVIAGWTESFGAGLADVYLVRTDSLGDTVWTRTYGGVDEDYGYSVQQTQDGGFMIAGATQSVSAASRDIYLVKTDPLGDSVWTRTCGGVLFDCGWSVRETEDGGYIIAGATESFGAGSRDVYLVKIDSLGDSVWTRTYGGFFFDSGWSIDRTQDGGYVIAGWTSSFSTGFNDFYLVRTDSAGDSVWTRTYGGVGEDYGYSVQQTLDGGYIVAGATESFGAGSGDVYLVRTDSLGDTLWARTRGGISPDCGWSVEQTQDGGCVIAGTTESFGAGSRDVYLVKTDGNGLTGIEERGTKSPVPRQGCDLLQNHPNPFDRSTVIFYFLPSAAHVTLAIYDITGRPVETLVNETRQPGTHEVRWNRKSNSSGVYFYGLKVGPSSETRKMVVVD